MYGLFLFNYLNFKMFLKRKSTLTIDTRLITERAHDFFKAIL